MAPSRPRVMQRLILAVLALTAFWATTPAHASSFTLFESGQV